MRTLCATGSHGEGGGCGVEGEQNGEIEVSKMNFPPLFSHVKLT